MKKKDVVLLVALTCLMNFVMALNFSWSLYESALHDMAGWSHTQASLPLTVFSMCYCLFVTPAGLFQDRYGARRTILLGSLIMGVGLVTCAVTMTVPGVVAGFGVIYPLGLVAAYAANVGNALKNVPAEKRGAVSGIVISAVGISGIISAQVSGAVINRLGISPAFLAMAAYSTPVLLLGAFLLGQIPGMKGRPKAQDKPAPAAEGQKTPSSGAAGEETVQKGQAAAAADAGTPDLTLRQTIRTKRFYLLVLVNLLGCMAQSSVSTHIVSISKLQAGVAAERAQIFVTLIAVCNFAGRLATGFISDHVPRKYILSVMFALDVAVLALFRFFTNGLLIGVGIGLVTLTGAALMVLVPVLITDFFGAKYYGQNYGIVNTFSVINSVMPVIVGSIVDRTGSYHGAFLLGTALAAVTFVLTLLLPKTGVKTGQRAGK